METQSTKKFSLRQIFKDAIQGHLLLWLEFCKLFKFSPKRSSKVGTAERPSTNVVADEDDDAQQVGISYGAIVYSKLWAALGIFGLYFVTDIQPGLHASTRFVIACYAAIAGWCAMALVLTYMMGWQLSKILFKDLVNNFELAVVSLVTSCLIANLAHATFSTSWVLAQRRFLHELLSNTFIRTAKSFQRQQMVRTFVLTVLFSCSTEPLFVASSLWIYITQEYDVFASIDEILFSALKYYLITSCGLIIFTLNVTSAFVPIVTSFLISNIAKYSQSLLSTQLNRIRYSNTTDVHNPHLLARLNDYERRLIADYSCHSITMDWPSLGDKEHIAYLPADNAQVQSETEDEANIARLDRRTRPVVDRTAREARLGRPSRASGALGADALLFAYRNLIKDLNRIKDFIRTYERRFGYIHLAQIYISGLITAQWVVFGLLQMRNSEARRSDTSTQLSWSDLSMGFVRRAALSVTTFVISNVSTFVRADRLPQQLAKMRSQLFRYNVELTRCSIAANQQRARQEAADVDRRPELEQVWLLYDQAVRMSLKARFRLGSSMFYDKNCLVQIFFSEVSAILVVIQLIDLYKIS